MKGYIIAKPINAIHSKQIKGYFNNLHNRKNEHNQFDKWLFKLRNSFFYDYPTK